MNAGRLRSGGVVLVLLVPDQQAALKLGRGGTGLVVRDLCRQAGVTVIPAVVGGRHPRELLVERADPRGDDALGLQQFLGHLREVHAPSALVLALSRDLPVFCSWDLTRMRAALLQEDDRIPFWKLPLSALWSGEPWAQRTIIDVLPRGVESEDLIAFLRKGEGPILLEGPTGTGKTQMAGIINDITRPGKPFRSVNVAALRGDEAQSLYRGIGHRRFTEVAERRSVFQECDGGTILLDDFQACPGEEQVRLLDLLQASSTRVSTARTGDPGKDEWEADVQVVLAVNEPLETLVRERRIRRDIVARVQRRLPLHSLRQRLEGAPSAEVQRDYLRLVILDMQERSFRLTLPEWVRRMFPEDLGARFMGALSLTLADGRLAARFPHRFREYMPIPDELLAFSWPGNFRDLEAFAQRLLAESRTIGVWNEEFARQAFEQVAIEEREGSKGASAPGSADTGETRATRMMALAHLRAVERPGATLSLAARELMIDPRTLQRMLQVALADRTSASVAPRLRQRAEALFRELSPGEREALRGAAARLLGVARPP